MFTLKVSGMTCGGCINAITRAVKAQDPQAQVQADLATQSVSLETTLTPELVTQLLEGAGYPVSK
jgi:copper chaperone